MILRSIRLSLLAYFVLLVSASLGVASVLIYRAAATTLREKEEATAELIEANYQKRREKESQRLNDDLLDRAQGLARRVRMEVLPRPVFIRERDVRPYFLMTWLALPNAHFTTSVFALRMSERRLSPPHPPLPTSSVYTTVVKFHLPDPELLVDPEAKVREYFQIDSNYPGSPLKSATLDNLSLPSHDDFAPIHAVAWRFDDYKLTPEKLVRRVRLKTVSRVSTTGPRPGPPRPPTSSNWSRIARTAILIQCAADLECLDETMASVRDIRDEQLAELSEQTAAALTRQRNWLLVISGLTFIATVLGCFGLVRLGLRPLRRLSDAVSQVSPRNFTLPLGEHALPVELQPIADRLSATLDLLRRAFDREKQATADISHELRTPLAALLTTIELALRKQRSPEQYREMLQECHGSAMHMHQIVERLLTLARIDAGVDRLRSQEVDVADLAEQCATVIRPLAEARGLKLSVVNACPAAVSADAEARLTTDPDKLREVLNNLLHNAIQYNRPEGKIDLVVARKNEHVQVEVRDTGIGIAAEVRERIFERFYRADPSRACDGMNAGLGLAIVKEYVELMGGHISVASALGEGSTFRVELPVQAPASAA